MNDQPILIEIFGIDGAGKTTLTHNLKSELSDRGYLTQLVSPLQISDPFLKSIRALIQRIPRSQKLFHKRAEAFFASYFSYAFVDLFLKTFTDQIDVIICDRYLNSHFLNQATFGADLEGLDSLFDLLPPPTISLMIDLPLEVALSRIQLRGNAKKHEQEGFLKKSREMHLDLAKKKRLPLLDGSLTRKELLFQTIDVLESHGFKLSKKEAVQFI